MCSTHPPFFFEGDIVVRGGITARNFGQTLRRFIGTVFRLIRGDHRE